MIYVVVALLIILVIYIISMYNGLIKMKNTLKEAFATMDVYMKKRWDLIPNLVEVVKGYAKHEKDTFAEIISMRNGPDYSTLSDEDKVRLGSQMGKAVSKIFALAESYPELKANQNFLDLSQQLQKIENDIANSRKYYNAAVREYNNKIEMFPSSIIASMFNFKTAESFQIDEEQRENVKVEF